MSGCCHWFAPSPGGDNIWQVDTANLKYGRGALRELGQDAEMLNLKKVALFTDKNQRNLPHLHEAVEALQKQNIQVTIFDEISVEPTSTSFKHATKFAEVR
jgi:alcohol dehydrogenase class IV